MAYVFFDKTKPDATLQTLAQMGQSMLANEKATRDATIMGTTPFWNGVVSGGTTELPAQTLHSNGTERIKETYTWGAGVLVSTLYEYSADSGGTWSTIGLWTPTYDGTTGAVVAWNWS